MMNTDADASRFQEQLLEAVRQAMAEREDTIELARMRAAFTACQEELQGVQHKLADVTQTVDAYREASRLRAEKVEQMDNRIATLTAEIALLRSALENQEVGE